MGRREANKREFLQRQQRDRSAADHNVIANQPWRIGRRKFGREFCKATLIGDMAAIRPLITDALARDIDHAAAAGDPGRPCR